MSGRIKDPSGFFNFAVNFGILLLTVHILELNRQHTRNSARTNELLEEILTTERKNI
jgi:hypothetical protein